MESFTKDRRRAVVFHYTAVDAEFDESDLQEAVRGQEAIAAAYAQFDRTGACDI